MNKNSAKIKILACHKASYLAATKVILTEFSNIPSKYLNFKDPLEQRLAMGDHIHAHALYRDAMRGSHAPLPKVSLWSGVVAVAIVTYEINQEKADVFWRDLASDQPSSPAIHWLQKQLALIHNDKPSQIYVARLTALAWNRWSKDPSCKAPNKRYIQAIDEPIYIHGSDKYTGKQKLDTAQLSGRRGQ